MQNRDVLASSNIKMHSTTETVIRVLCVDDERSLLQTTKSILELQASFEIETASSVDEALQKMAQKEFDVIVSDYQMSFKNGLDFLKELRDSGKAIPFILFTGKGREEVAVKALNLGADRYFNKIGHPETVYGELSYGIKQLANKKKVENEAKRLSSVIEQSSNAIVIVDKQEKIVYVNPAFLQFHGARFEDIIGTSWQDLIAEGTPLKEEAQEIRKTVFIQKNVWSKEIFNKTKTGETYWRRAKIFPLLDENNEVTNVVYNGEDITRQKRSEQVIWDREERLRAIIASSPDAMIVTDVHGNLVDCNIETLKLLGVSSRKDIMGEDCYKFIAKENLEKVRETVPRLLEQGAINNVECKLLRKNGSRIDVEFSANTLRDAYGKPVGAVVLARKITARKRAEEKLRDSEKKFRTISDSAQDSIILLDENGEIIYWNPAAEKKFGYTKKEAIGKELHSFIAPKRFYEKYSIGFKKFKETGQGYAVGKTLELFAKRKDEKEFPIELSLSALKIKDKWCATGIIRDITERKKAEKVLAKERDTLEKVTGNLDVSLAIISKDYRILWANNHTKNQMGEITGKKCYKIFSGLEHVCPECKVEEIFKTGKQTVRQQTVKNPKMGTIILKIASIPIKDENGNVTEVLELAVDITEGKKAENSMKKTLKKLETLNEKLGVIGKLTRHDINNKLATIINNTYLAKTNIDNNQVSLEYLENVETTIEQIEKILEFSRIYEILGTQEKTTINVKKIVDEAFTLASRSYKIELANECKNLTVQADSLLRQVFYNLIENSTKHGKNVTKIKINYKQEKNALKIIYSDNGIGIPKIEKENIFQEGYGKGTGYGLYLIRKICDEYNWTITEKGEPGKGAKFIISTAR